MSASIMTHIACVIAVIAQGGLRLSFLHEHKVLDWQFMGTMVKDEDASSLGFGGYRLPAHQVYLPPVSDISAFPLSFCLTFLSRLSFLR